MKRREGAGRTTSEDLDRQRVGGKLSFDRLFNLTEHPVYVIIVRRTQYLLLRYVSLWLKSGQRTDCSVFVLTIFGFSPSLDAVGAVC